jgi:glycosyltransferase involved in cell wall biosynthesis
LLTGASGKKMNYNPLISIIIPVYNGSDYLAEAIDSALAQTYRNIEILVINDGSSDEGATREVALIYGSKIRYFEKENGGVATALNLGISEMKGDYFSWLSHDDKYLPNKINDQIDYLSKLEDKNKVLYSDVEFIDKNSKFLYQSLSSHYPPENFRPAFIKDGLINGCTLLIPKVCFKKCGLFDTSLKITQDYDLWFKISEKFEFIHQPNILIQSRLHEKQDSIRYQNTCHLERDNLQLFFIKNISFEEIKHFSNGDIAGYYIAFAIKMVAYMCIKAEKYAIEKAYNNLFKSNFLKIFQNIFKLIILFIFSGAKKTFIYVFGLKSFIKIKQAFRFSGSNRRLNRILSI